MLRLEHSLFSPGPMRFLSLYLICQDLDPLTVLASLVKQCEGCSALFAIARMGKCTSTLLCCLEWVPEVGDIGTYQTNILLLSLSFSETTSSDVPPG